MMLRRVFLKHLLIKSIIGKISGKNTSSPIKHLTKNHIKGTNKKDIADLLAKIFSSLTNNSKPFQNIKKNAEKSKLNFKSNKLKSSQATIIPKPGKDNTDPSNYRPIALTS